MSFKDLQLNKPLLRAIAEAGYDNPTLVQERTIPLVLDKKDVITSAQTGTGKTAAFALPILQLLFDKQDAPKKGKKIRALIISPTRELAIQINDNFKVYGKNTNLRSTVIYGGTSIEPQKDILNKGVDILIATPGRLLDLHKQDIIYGLIVVAAVFVLFILTNKLFKWLSEAKKRKFPEDPLGSFNILKRILNVLWIVLGVIALTYLIVDESQQDTLADDFKKVLYLGIVISLTIIASTSSNIWFKHDIQKKIESEQDPTNFQFLRYIVLVGIYFIGLILCLLAFPSLKGIAQTALGGAGVLALIAGFASQEALSNVIGGVFIVLFKPFKIGDLIKVTDTMVGTVKDITLRHTVIRNFENKMIVIPNSVINKERLINYHLIDKKCCERIEIRISYDSDIDLAKKIMQEECENHPLILDNRSELDIEQGKPIVKTAVIELNESAVVVRAWTWERSYDDSFQLKIDVLESIKKRFDKEGVKIPFPHRTIVMKKEN